MVNEAHACDELLLMRGGAILEQTTPAGLREQTGEHDLAQAFLAVSVAATLAALALGELTRRRRSA
jgi:ABC-type multidrug transport system ATPase subunit